MYGTIGGDILMTDFALTHTLRLWHINLSKTLIMQAKDMQIDTKIILDFKNNIIPNLLINTNLINYLGNSKGSNRESLTLLKNHLLKQKNNIDSLTLHRLEFNTYYKTLITPLKEKLCAIFTKHMPPNMYSLPLILRSILFPIGVLVLLLEYFLPIPFVILCGILLSMGIFISCKYKKYSHDIPILLFEKYASDFGTNTYKAMFWWFGVVIFFGVLIYSLGINWQAKDIPSLSTPNKNWVRITPLGDDVADVFTVTNVSGQTIWRPWYIKDQQLLAYAFNPIAIISNNRQIWLP